MNLHFDKEIFEELIVGASNELAIPGNVIEKDYYVTITLKSLSEKLEDMVFKGGTSLTKCYGLLERFSEDIDLSYTAEAGMPGDARKKKLKRAIVKTMDEFGFTVTNLDATRSRRHYNCYRVTYPSMYERSNILKPELVVETYVALLPFPTTKRMEITTQTIERTLADKVFALCDYYMQGEVERHSRHLYDIYKIVSSIGITEELVRLIPAVRAVRSELTICPSAKADVCVTDILKEIVENGVYRDDYNNITLGLLFVPETYDTVIQSIKQLADSGIFGAPAQNMYKIRK